MSESITPPVVPAPQVVPEPPVLAPPAPTPSPVAVHTPPVLSVPPVPPKMDEPKTITIPIEQLNTYLAAQAELVNTQAQQRLRDQEAHVAQVRLLAEKGEVENALKLQRETAEHQMSQEKQSRAALEDRAKRYALDGELSRVLASQPLVPGGAEQLTQLWRSQFAVEPQGDTFAVRTPHTFQSVHDFVTSQLAQPNFAHFIRPSTQGGVGPLVGASHTNPTPPAVEPAPVAVPKNLSEAILMSKDSWMRQPSTADGRLDMRVGFGLKRA